jgi:hypothetical protein
MPKPDGTMTFEEWLMEEAKTTEFEEGDSPEKFLKLGKEFLEEELRKEEERLRARRSKKRLRKNIKPKGVNMKKSSKNTSQVINYKGMQYAPQGELGVVYLFSKLQRELGYTAITRIRDAFPDCEAIRHNGERVRIEFEYKSGNFLNHHKPVNQKLKDIDAIICWEDNWPAEKRSLINKHRVEILDLRKHLGLGSNVWFHVVKKHYQKDFLRDLRREPKTLHWPCHKSAKKKDLLIDYIGAPGSYIIGIKLLTSDAYLTKNDDFKYRAECRRIAVLDKPIHMNKMRSEKSLIGAFFLKPNGLQGSPRVTEYWPQLSELILRLNPKLKSKVREYTSWD